MSNTVCIRTCILSLCIAFSFAPNASRALTQGDYTYTTNAANQATITGFNKNYSGALSITNALGGCPVTVIGTCAFYGCTGLTGITIPDSVTVIGQSAFNGCTGLPSVHIPFGVTDIQRLAFVGCRSLKAFTVDAANKNYSSIDGILFNKNQTTLVHFPGGKTGQNTITIQPGVTSVDACAFSDCANLSSVIIPASVTSIGQQAIWCPNLRTITVDAVNKNYCSVDGVLFDKNLAVTTLIQYPRGRVGAYKIPDTVKIIGSDAFCGCNGLTNVVIGSGVERIYHNAFYGCTGLTTVVIGNGVERIWQRAFSGCTGLTNAIIGASVNIDETAFDGCTNLPRSIYSVKSINGDWSVRPPLVRKVVTLTQGDYTYTTNDVGQATITGFNKDYSGVLSITNTLGGCPVTGIDCSFYAHTNLTSITLPATVTKIKSSFSTTVAVDKNNTSYSSRDGILFNKQQTSLIKCPRDKSGSYQIPDGVASIERYAFFNCTDLTDVTLPDSVTNLGFEAFSGCAGLTSVKLTSGITSIGSPVFNNCANLTTVFIPSGVAQINSSAFGGCTSLTNISVDTANAYYSSLDGILFNKDKSVLVRYPIGKSGTCTIPDSVTIIEDRAFDGCSKLTCVDIPANICSLGDNAFNGCITLTNITIPDSVIFIGQHAFAGCSGLSNIHIPSNVKVITQGAFSSCSGLSNIQIPDNVTNIEQGAFANCIGLTNATIGAGVSSIGTVANNPFSRVNRVGKEQAYKIFEECTNLASITVSPANPFFNSTNGMLFSKDLTTLIRCPEGITGHVTIPNGILNIGPGAFLNCTGLTSVTIPESVTYIRSDSFQGCTNLPPSILAQIKSVMSRPLLRPKQPSTRLNP